MVVSASPSLSSPELKIAHDAVAAAKIALLKTVKEQAATKHLNDEQVKKTLALADAMIEKNRLKVPVDVHPQTESVLLGMLKKNLILNTVLELAMRAEKLKEEKKAETQKQEDKKKAAEQKAKHDDKPHQKPEMDIDDAVEAKENEPKSDKPEDVELEDVQDLSHDAEALRDIDIPQLQADLMQDIQNMPSVGDQAAWMFIVSQLDTGNSAFRAAGAAHLMQHVKNGSLSTEDQLLAFAGVKSLHNPTSSPFARSASVTSGAKPNASVSLNTKSALSDKKLLDVARKTAKQENSPVKAAFKDNIEMVDNVAELEKPEPVWEQTAKKAKNIFGDTHFKLEPNAAFFDAVLGKRSDN